MESEDSEAKKLEIREKAQEIVANDLKTWQEKFAKAADEGSEELEQRIAEIAETLIKQANGVGNALIVQLEETVTSGLKSLKSNIISIVESKKDVEESEEELTQAVRKVGLAIKDKGQAVRTWRQNFDQETNSLMGQAASDTFEILDLIRDMGLQEIGMRWAWTEGITHKDWTKYHKLKGKFDEWRLDVERVIIDHPGLGNTREASEDIESKAMGIAEEAAKELARLKETGRWKISVGDTSDDFSTKHMPAAAASLGKKIKEKIVESETAKDTLQETVVEAVSAASSIVASQAGNAQSVASGISESVIGTKQGTVESLSSVGSSSASSLASEASSAIIGGQQGSVQSMASMAKASADSIVDQASSSVIGTSQGTIESIASIATESAKSAASGVSSSISSASSQVSSVASEASSSLSSATSSIASSLSKSIDTASSSVESAASTASSSASKKVWGGAMAQKVEARQIIFDDVIEDSDDDTFSEKLQSMASEAGDKYADITNAVSEALLKPSTTQSYQVTELASQKYSSALAAASSALYGTEKGTGESVASVASSRYSDAVSAYVSPSFT